jgi:hypothetical protein
VKTLLKLLFSTLAIMMIGSVVVDTYGVEPVEVVQFVAVATASLVVVRLAVLIHNPNAITKFEHGLVLDLAVEFWDSVIAENLFKGYEWLTRARNRSGNVMTGVGGARVVHIPQAGAAPNVVRNRQNYPIPMVKRSDLDLTYTMDELSSDTTAVFNAEKWELSYAKIPDIIKDHINQLNFRAAQNALYRWLGKNANETALSKIKVTSGGNFDSSLYYTGLTGNRKLPLVADIQSAKTQLITDTKREINPGKRALIMDENFYTLLLSDTTFANDQLYKKVGAEFANGDLVKLLGFDIIRTDALPKATAANVAKDTLDASVTVATDDNPIALLVDFDFVHYAKTDPKLFYEADKVELQGDAMNALLVMGASRERKDDAGVVMISADA